MLGDSLGGISINTNGDIDIIAQNLSAASKEPAATSPLVTSSSAAASVSTVPQIASLTAPEHTASGALQQQAAPADPQQAVGRADQSSQQTLDQAASRTAESLPAEPGSTTSGMEDDTAGASEHIAGRVDETSAAGRADETSAAGGQIVGRMDEGLTVAPGLVAGQPTQPDSASLSQHGTSAGDGVHDLSTDSTLSAPKCSELLSAGSSAGVSQVLDDTDSAAQHPEAVATAAAAATHQDSSLTHVAEGFALSVGADASSSVEAVGDDGDVTLTPEEEYQEVLELPYEWTEDDNAFRKDANEVRLAGNLYLVCSQSSVRCPVL